MYLLGSDVVHLVWNFLTYRRNILFPSSW